MHVPKVHYQSGTNKMFECQMPKREFYEWISFGYPFNGVYAVYL